MCVRSAACLRNRAAADKNNAALPAAAMEGLEWSTGSSTQWVLMRIKSLISIEHHAKWSKMVEEALQKIYSPQVCHFRMESAGAYVRPAGLYRARSCQARGCSDMRLAVHC